MFDLQGGFAPLTPDQGLCPWIPLGAPDPRYRLAHSARHGAMPPPQKKKIQARTATVLSTRAINDQLELHIN